MSYWAHYKLIQSRITNGPAPSFKLRARLASFRIKQLVYTLLLFMIIMSIIALGGTGIRTRDPPTMSQMCSNWATAGASAWPLSLAVLIGGPDHVLFEESKDNNNNNLQLIDLLGAGKKLIYDGSWSREDGSGAVNSPFFYFNHLDFTPLVARKVFAAQPLSSVCIYKYYRGWESSGDTALLGSRKICLLRLY